MQVASIRHFWARPHNMKFRRTKSIAPRQQGLRNLAVLEARRNLGEKHVATEKRGKAFGNFRVRAIKCGLDLSSLSADGCHWHKRNELIVWQTTTQRGIQKGNF